MHARQQTARGTSSGCHQRPQLAARSAAGAARPRASCKAVKATSSRAAGAADQREPLSEPQLRLSRRGAAAGFAAAAAAALQLLPAPASSAEPAGSSSVHVDPDGFQLEVPAGWQSSEGLLDGNKSFTGSSGARRTLAWWPADLAAEDVNVTLTITNTSAEFTKLGSFGNVFAFATNLVNSMDRSFLLRARNPGNEPIQVAKLVDARDTRDMYEVFYTVEKVPGPKRHLYSLVALAFNGRYNRLYTLTAQCKDDQVAEWEPKLLQVLASFNPPATA